VIQEELLKEFSSNSELSNWFGREDTTPPTVVVKKVNPKNVQNQDKIKELEEQIQKYVSSLASRSEILTGADCKKRGTLSTHYYDLRQFLG
jgi:kinetochore protein Mis13/DSN1